MGLIWIQTIGHSDGIPERFFEKKLIFFFLKNLQTTKKHVKLPSMQKVNSRGMDTLLGEAILIKIAFAYLLKRGLL